MIDKFYCILVLLFRDSPSSLFRVEFRKTCKISQLVLEVKFRRRVVCNFLIEMSKEDERTVENEGINEIISNIHEEEHSNNEENELNDKINKENKIKETIIINEVIESEIQPEKQVSMDKIIPPRKEKLLVLIICCVSFFLLSSASTFCSVYVQILLNHVLISFLYFSITFLFKLKFFHLNFFLLFFYFFFI